MGREKALLNKELLASAIGEAIGDRWSTSEVAAAAELLAETDGQFPKTIPAGMLDQRADQQRARLPSELVKAVQRERILAAMLRVVGEIGYHDVRVQNVLDKAGLSRPTFYEQFDNKESCFLAAFDAAAKRLRESVEAAGEGGEHWRDRIRLGLEALLRFIATEPDAAYTLIVESRGAGPAGVLRHDDLFEHFARCIDAQVHKELPEAPSKVAADGVVGGIASVLYARLNKGELDDLDSLLPSLMYFAVLPYGGHKAAAEELSGAAPA